jgi:PAS domain-containing protein
MLRLAKNQFEIRWTCVPSDVVKGASSDELRLKIVVAPRVPLDAEALAAFEDLFSRWPEIVRNDLSSFDVSFATAKGVVANLKGRVIPDGIVKDKSVWAKAFPSLAARPESSKNPETLFVDQGFGSSYNAVTAERQVQSRRMVQVLGDLLTPQTTEEYLLKWQLEQILAMATATLSLQGPEAYEPSAQPSAVTGLYGLSEWEELTERQKKLLARNDFRAVADGNSKSDARLLLNSAARSSEQTGRINFLAADAMNDCVVFNTRVKPLRDTPDSPSLKAKEPDFAERLGLVRQYPELSALLALTLEVRLSLDDVKKAVGGAIQDPSLRVWATPDWKHSDVSVARAPGTLCRIDADKKSFAASERMSDGVQEDNEHLNGHLRLNNGKWKLTTLDIDGASIKNETYAVSRREIAPAFVTDVNGRMLQANFSAYALFRREKGSLAGQGMWTCVHEETLRPMLEGLRVAGVPLRAAKQRVALLDEKGERTGETVTLQGHVERFSGSGQRVIAWTVLPAKGGQVADRGVSPSCRTAGLGLVRADADYAMFDVDKRMEQLFSEGDPELGKPILVASDLILGYVPEIWAPPVQNPNAPGRWYSLTKREVLFPELGIAKYVNDGHLSIGVGEAQDAAPRDQVEPERQGYVSPGLFTYTNAPLGAPLDGKSFTLPEELPGGTTGPDPLRVHLTPVAGSLPLVRYSSISTKPFFYHVRCRAVDVAGNSRKLDPKVLGSPELWLKTFVERQESVAPPRVLTDGRLNLIANPGAKLKTLVVTDTLNCDSRMLIPPKCTSDMALRFGKLVDGRIQNGHWQYIQLDKYAEVPEEECIQPPTVAGEKKKKTPTFRYARVNQTQPGFYYFPDPDCKFASLVLHPFYSPGNHVEPIRVRIPFYAGRHWPNPIPIRVSLYALAAGEVEPRVVVGHASANVYLPWGWTAYAEISSCRADSSEDAEQCRRHFATLSGGGESIYTTFFGVPPIASTGARSREEGGVLELLSSPTFVEAASSAIKTFALAKPLQRENGEPLEVGPREDNPLEILQTVGRLLEAIPPEKRTLRYLVSGAVREITPPEQLHFVCATRTPLVAPSLAINGVSGVGTHGREKEATVAHLTVSSVVDEKSTSELTIMASWRRLQDDPALGDPICVWDRTELPVHKLSEPRTLEPIPSYWRQDLDLRSPGYRRVRYRLTALSRFWEYFSGTKKAALSCKGGNDVQIDHLNVARPKEPPLRYLVPTHTWTSSVHPLINKPKWEFRSRRRNGIRVYLGRGWELEELLGVIVHPRLSQHDAEELNAGRYPLLTPATSVVPSLMDSITQWGADPIVRSGLPGDLPAATDFEGFRYVAADVSLPLADGSHAANCDRNVAVVGYKPKWHPERKLWYCDIGLRRIPSYGCFLRMIVARFQPKSIKGMELSAPVVADFIQILPERTVSVTRDPFDKQGRTLRVVVYEPEHEAKTVLDPAAGVSNRFEVHLEQPCAFPTGDEFGWTKDTKIEPILEPATDKNVLYCARIVIPNHTGRRRLVVREFETWKYQLGEDQRVRERECFCNTLEL